MRSYLVAFCNSLIKNPAVSFYVTNPDLDPSQCSINRKRLPRHPFGRSTVGLWHDKLFPQSAKQCWVRVLQVTEKVHYIWSHQALFDTFVGVSVDRAPHLLFCREVSSPPSNIPSVHETTAHLLQQRSSYRNKMLPPPPLSNSGVGCGRVPVVVCAHFKSPRSFVGHVLFPLRVLSFTYFQCLFC